MIIYKFQDIPEELKKEAEEFLKHHKYAEKRVKYLEFVYKNNKLDEVKDTYLSKKKKT